jgi:SPX domain protein involved in polyphosphate accumulation
VRLRWYDVGEPQTVFVERKTHRESCFGEVSVGLGRIVALHYFSSTLHQNC